MPAQGKKVSPEEMDRIIEMAWEDRTPFDAIFNQFGLREDDVKALMKRELHPRNWRKWRARVSGRDTKHAALRQFRSGPFKCSRQRSVTGNRISKRG
jgi:uncharacterized protein (TIGR03643 family)